MTHMLSGGVENEKERALKKRLIDQFDGSFCLWTVLLGKLCSGKYSSICVGAAG